jgi:hypothetical protein
MPTTDTERPALAVRVERHDGHRLMTASLTALAMVGLVMAGAMAIWGLPPISLHGPLFHLGIMEPFCGGTRAAYLFASGDVAGAWTYNPLGIVAVLGAALVTLRTAVGLTTRRWVNLYTDFTRNQRRALWAAVVLLFVLMTIRQNMRAELLMTWGTTL